MGIVNVTARARSPRFMPFIKGTQPCKKIIEHTVGTVG